MKVVEFFLSQKMNADISLEKIIVDFIPEYAFEEKQTFMKLHELNSVSYLSIKQQLPRQELEENLSSTQLSIPN